MENVDIGIRHTFIQNLKFYRKQAGLTQEKLEQAVKDICKII